LSSKTTYHSRNGWFTGKTVTKSHGDGSKTISNYKAHGSGLSRALLGPSWSNSSTTRVDSKGNSRTKTY
jgi:hypothetical protein